METLRENVIETEENVTESTENVTETEESELGLETGPRDIEVITTEILLFKQQAGEDILEIGRRLIEAKAQLGHGEWLPYLRDRVEFSVRTAQEMMRLAEAYPNTRPGAYLGAKKALQLLALPASEREDFIAQKHTVNGEEKTVEEMTKRELQEAIQARERAEQERDAALAEKEKSEGFLRDQLEMEQRSYETEMANTQVKLREAYDNAEKARQAEIELKAKLAELEKPQPPDPKAIDAARKDAAEKARMDEARKLKAQIEKAEKDAKKANDEKAKAEQAAAAAKATYEQAAQLEAKEKEILAGQVEDLRKKLALAGSSEMTVFKLHFEAMQEQANKMLGCISRTAESGNADMADKMRSAVRACCEAVISGVEAQT